MKLSLSQITTVDAPFRADLDAYVAAGFDGIGIWEVKLAGDDAGDLAAFRESSLEATNCVPTIPTILPNPVMPGPNEAESRLELMRAGIKRLSAFGPGSIVCLTGPTGGFGEREGRRLVIEGLRELAGAAEAVGVTLALEPITHREPEFSFIHSVPDALELLDEAGLPDVGVMFDTYHLWDTPTVFDDIERHIGRFTGVHIADWPGGERTDRLLPGEGVSRTAELVAALAAAGWDGHLDVEIFSTPEAFWGLPVEDAARQAYAAARSVLPAS